MKISRQSFKWHLTWLPYLVVPFFILACLGIFWFYIPKLIYKNVAEDTTAHAIAFAKHFKVLRKYYTKNVVSKILADGTFKVNENHSLDALTIPLPATMIHDISDMLKEENSRIDLVSPYPFPHRKSRKFDKFQQAAWKYFKTDSDKPFVERLSRKDGTFLRVAIADYMVSETCVSCHNSHPLTPKNDWKLGDVRGILEVTIPLDKQLTLSENTVRQIIILVMITGTLVILTSLFFARLSFRKLHVAKIQAERANVAKSEFLANMSHEIRTPMNGVLGLIQVLLDSGLTRDQKEKAGMIYNAGESLEALLNDILDISKIEEGQLDIENIYFDLRNVCKGLGVNWGGRYSAKGLLLNIVIDDDIPKRVFGDPTRIRQILSNFISNALKFTEVGQVDLKITRIAGDDGLLTLRFEVSDCGIGLKPEQIGGLFERFTQADISTTRQYGGSGLGLAICKSLVDLMGGEIGVHSEPGQGATFWFTLETKEGPEIAFQAPILEGKKNLYRKKYFAADILLLVVDDNVLNHAVTGAFLSAYGIRFETANDGQQAVDKVKSTDYDLILMDMQMPVMGGVEAADVIRRLSPEKAGLTIIAMTANAMKGDREKYIAAGLNDHIAKPLKKDALFEMLTRYLPLREDGSEV